MRKLLLVGTILLSTLSLSGCYANAETSDQAEKHQSDSGLWVMKPESNSATRKYGCARCHD